MIQLPYKVLLLYLSQILALIQIDLDRYFVLSQVHSN